MYGIHLNTRHKYSTLHSSKSAWMKNNSKRIFVRTIHSKAGRIKIYKTKNTLWCVGFKCQRDAIRFIDELEKRLGIRKGL